MSAAPGDGLAALRTVLPHAQEGIKYNMCSFIVNGEGVPADLDKLDLVASKIEGRTICALGDAAAMPVQGMLKHFRDEFAYHVEHKTCMVPQYV